MKKLISRKQIVRFFLLLTALNVFFIHAFAAEKWYIDGCQVIRDEPRKTGSTVSGACGVNESLEHRTTTTFPIAEIDLSKGLICDGKSNCIAKTITLYKDDNKYTTCTSEYPLETENGSPATFPKHITSEAKSKKEACFVRKLNEDRRAIKEESNQGLNNRARQLCELQKKTCIASCPVIRYSDGSIMKPDSSCTGRCESVSCN